MVDAVCEVPCGSHPGNMPLLYYSDEEHMAEWLASSRSEEGVKQYLDKYVYPVEGFAEYVALIGGEKKMAHLRQLERLEVPLTAPWARRG
jgi:hypothetical protein